jgi:hypothetical protein
MRLRCAAVGIASTIMCVLSACSSHGRDSATSPSPSRAATGPTSNSPTSRAPKPPPAPGTLAATALASTDLVAQLHDTAALLMRHSGLPTDTMTAQAADLHRQFASLSNDVDATTSLGTRLARQLHRYDAVALRLARNPAPASNDLGRTLAVLDTEWRATLRQIGAHSGTNLLGALPPLLLPASKANVIPSPPN